jgi:demethylmenaquinone methyltransferase/2-methoxy-6-polyprenyl-1,4-benzoquinol methylase
MPGANRDPLWTPELLESPHRAPDKSSRVRRMFNAIAPRYELINSLFSFRQDAYWRRRAVQLAAVRGDDDVLDVACGTGDFARAFGQAGPRRVVGCDFAHEMLIRAASGRERTVGPASGSERTSHRAATVRERTRNSVWIEADALCLPFRDGSFSIVSCAFGVRNFVDLDRGLCEMHRVLRRGGRAVVLEFTRPPSPIFRRLYEFYSNRLMPTAASWISGDRSGAYRYLPRSVVSFLDAGQMGVRLADAGFSRVSATPLTMGIVTIYVAERT